jgi:diguanylate cyclase (GGDEF)-like protein
MEKLSDEFQKGMNENLPLSIFLVDLDHFKKINDNYGHQTGDCALEYAADVLKKSVRITDFVGRFGGEEFLVILPKTTQDEAVQVAERFRSTLEQGHVIYNDIKIRVTASIGLRCRIPKSTDEQDHFLAEADVALYSAKSAGRNRLSV